MTSCASSFDHAHAGTIHSQAHAQVVSKCTPRELNLRQQPWQSPQELLGSSVPARRTHWVGWLRVTIGRLAVGELVVGGRLRIGTLGLRCARVARAFVPVPRWWRGPFALRACVRKVAGFGLLGGFGVGWWRALGLGFGDRGGDSVATTHTRCEHVLQLVARQFALWLKDHIPKHSSIANGVLVGI